MPLLAIFNKSLRCMHVSSRSADPAERVSRRQIGDFRRRDILTQRVCRKL
jgi:hypothetical protein